MYNRKPKFSNLIITGFSCFIVGMVIASPTLASGFFDLGQLTDVDTTGVTNGQVIKYNSTSSEWEPEDDALGTGGGYSNIWNSSGADVYLNNSYTQVGIGDKDPINELELVGGFLVRSGLSDGYTAPSYGIFSEGEISVGDDGGSGHELTLYEATPLDECTIKMINGDTGGGYTDGYLMSLYSNTQFKHWLYENVPMVFATNNLERLRIESDGLVNVTGNLTANLINATIGFTTDTGVGWSGWIDDGANVNCTYRHGIIIGVVATTGVAGYKED